MSDDRRARVIKKSGPVLRQSKLVRLSDLKPAEYNPRRMPELEMEKLRRSIVEFGFVEPVVARAEDMMIVGGHQRVLAYRSLLEQRGEDPDKKKVPVVFVEGMSDERAKLLNLALNRISGEWDYDKLTGIFEELGAEWSDDVHGLTGFDAREVEDILALSDFAGGSAEIPDAGEVQEGLDRIERRFVFQLETEEDAEIVRSALRAKGWTGPGNAVSAFVEVCRCASDVRE